MKLEVWENEDRVMKQASGGGHAKLPWFVDGAWNRHLGDLFYVSHNAKIV